MSECIPTMADPAGTTSRQAHLDDTLDLKPLLAILRRRRRIIIPVVLLGTTLATLYGLLQTPLYTAQAAVVLAPQRSELINTDKLGYGLQQLQGSTTQAVA